MDITSLSDDSLLIIFDHVFCRTLLSSVPLVCTQWNQLQRVAGVKRRRLDLHLYQLTDFQFARLLGIKRRSNRCTKELYELHPRMFDLAYARALVNSFPAITKLLINHQLTIDRSEAALYLLEQWGPKLVDFDLSLKKNIHQDSAERLLPALNSMPRLQKLGLGGLSKNLPKIDMPILGRLVEIKLNFESLDDGIVLQILKHCSTDRVRHFDIKQVTHFASFALLLLSEQISSQIRHLKVADFDRTQLAAIFERCHCIRSLDMELPLEHFRERLCALVNQSSLQELILWIDEYNPSIPVASSINLPILGIETLQLFTCLISHRNFVRITQLDRVFPRLRVVYFISDERICEECKESGLSEEYCTGILLQPLVRIAGLKAVYCDWPPHGYVDWLPRLRKGQR